MKYELTLATSYVANWTYIEGMRELIQNMIDGVVDTFESKDKFNFLKIKEEVKSDDLIRYEDETIFITSKTTKLRKKTLLTGYTTKKNNDTSIGQFGEGYKLALLVLLREGKTVVIRNGADESWFPRFSRAKKFEGEKVLAIDVQKDTNPTDDLIFEIRGVSEEEWLNIKRRNLFLQDELGEYEVVTSRYNNDATNVVLKDEEFKGEVYINGLYVCEFEKLNFGYSFAPCDIQLDRDRMTAPYWDVIRCTSDAIGKLKDKEQIADLILDETEDTSHMKYTLEYKSEDEVKNKLESKFKERYTKNEEVVYPVSNQTEIETASLYGIKTALVKESTKALLKDRLDFEKVVFEKMKEGSLTDRLRGIERRLDTEIRAKCLDEDILDSVLKELKTVIEELDNK